MRTMRMRFPNGVRFAVCCLMIVATVGASGACGADKPKREYAIPDTLCGLKISKGDYAPIFGAGEKITRDSFDSWGGAGVEGRDCNYYIDGNPKVSVLSEWAKENDTAAPSTPAEMIRAHSGGKSRKYDGAYDVRTWKLGAVAAVDCPRPKGDEDASFTRFLLDIYANDTPLNDDPERGHKVFGKLAQAAMGEVVKKLPCREK